MSRHVIDKDLGWSRLLRQITAEAKQGYQTRDVGWTDPDLGERARYLEYGTSRMDAQPFIRPTLDAGKAKYQRALEQCATAVLDGNASAPELEDAAELLASDLRDVCPVDTGELRAGITVVEGS